MTDDLKHKLSEAFQAGKEFNATVNELNVPFYLVETARHMWLKWAEADAKTAEVAN